MNKPISDPPRPGTPEWRRTVSASKIPAILGLSRWTSQYAIWHEMAGLVEPAPVSEAQADRWQWGHIIEEALAQHWKAKHPGWSLNPRIRGIAELTYPAVDLPFPAIATIDRRARRGSRFHIIECKLAQDLGDNTESWGRPGEPDSVPADYFAQVQFQMGVSEIHEASIVVLGAFGNPEIHEIEFDQGLFDGIVDRVAVFVQSIDAGIPPVLDDSLATYETVRGLHPEIDRDKEVAVDMELARRIVDVTTTYAAAEKAMTGLKSEVADLMGEARLLKAGDVKLADRRARGKARPYVQFAKNIQLPEETL